MELALRPSIPAPREQRQPKRENAIRQQTQRRTGLLRGQSFRSGLLYAATGTASTPRSTSRSRHRMAQVSPATSAIEHRPWQEALAPYARPHVGRSALDLATSVVPYLALSVGMYLLLGGLLSARPRPRCARDRLPAAHVRRLPRLRARLVPALQARNAWLGTALGLLVFAPFVRWRHDHAVHHATSGDLDRRGVGDLPTITVAEYGAPIAASARPTGSSATRRSCSASGRWWR